MYPRAGGIAKFVGADSHSLGEVTPTTYERFVYKGLAKLMETMTRTMNLCGYDGLFQGVTLGNGNNRFCESKSY